MTSRDEKLAALRAARNKGGDAEQTAEKIRERKEQRHAEFENAARAAGMDLHGIDHNITDFLTGGLSAEEMIKQREAKKMDSAATRGAAPPPPPKK